MKPIPLILALILLTSALVAQTTREPKRLTAIRSDSPITIDGKLDEPVWQRPGTDDFMQRDPDEGALPTQRTEVWVAYDDAAVYIAARLHDTSPDSIVTRIGRRDADLNSDWFYVGIDSYHDKRTGFYFGVNPSGSINDGTLFNDESDDNSWDGVWESATTIDDLGWTVEMRIPYSQLRFRKQDEYVWGINFLRKIERRKEESWYVMVPKKESGGVSRYAELVGIREIDPPRKLEIVPYAASSARFMKRVPGDPFNDGSSFTRNLGADIRAGLGHNLTLSATINPDFGQVEVDPAVVNLTQFETFFEEKRPFFIEGSDFFRFGRGGVNSNWNFNWGNPEFFYTRRVGRPPRGRILHNGFTDFPDGTTILGAAKLTGKMADNWSLASVQAFTGREHARVDSSGVRFEDEIEPFSSITVLRTFGEFENGRHGLGFLGTALVRDFDQPHLRDDFNSRSYTLGIDGWTRIDDDQVWAVTGWAAATRIEGSTGRMLRLQYSPLHYFQRPDQSRLSIDSGATSLTGYAGRIAVNKQKGNWLFNSAVGVISPSFDSNDLGFMFQTNLINAHVVSGYRWLDPGEVFRRLTVQGAVFRNYNFMGERIGGGYFIFANGQFLNYWGFFSTLQHFPANTDTRNTRGGPAMMTTPFYGGEIGFYSDSRNDVVAEGGVYGGRSESGGYTFVVFSWFQWKPTAGFTISINPRLMRDVTVAQWVGRQDDPAAAHTFGSRYIFGRIDQREVSASIRIDWTFTPKLSLQVYLQPLISVGSYSQFKELAQPGTYTFSSYDTPGVFIGTDRDAAGNVTAYTFDPDGTGPAAAFSIPNPDFNFKSLRGNAILRWEYLPGSTLYLAWTQRRVNFEDPGRFRFHRDLGKLLSADAENVFLVKVAYWINP